MSDFLDKMLDVAVNAPEECKYNFDFYIPNAEDVKEDVKEDCQKEKLKSTEGDKM